MGALAEPVVRIAAAVADGWNGWGLAPERFAKKVAILREACAESGRDVEPTWAGIVLVGEDEADAERLREERFRKGMAEQAWTGSADSSWSCWRTSGTPARPGRSWSRPGRATAAA